MKPPIDLDRFRRLDLRVGTVSSVRPHPSLEDLSLVTVLLEEPVEALAPAPAAEAGLAGRQVIVARGLHPLSVGGLRFTHCLVPLDAEGASRITGRLPDGSRLV